MSKIEAHGDEELLNSSHNLHCLVKNIRDVIFEKNDPTVVILIAGYSAIGKSTLARVLQNSLNNCALISTDSFMMDRAQRDALNLIGDEPEAIDLEGLIRAVDCLRSGFAVEVPTYNHLTGAHTTLETIHPSKLLIVEGTSILYDQVAINHPTFSLFLDADAQTRFRLVHEERTKKRGHSEARFQRMNPIQEAANQNFITPSKNKANYIIRVNEQRDYASDLIHACTCMEKSVNYSADEAAEVQL